MIRRGTLDDRTRAVQLLRDSRLGAGFDSSAGATGFAFPFEPAYAARLFVNYLTAPKCLCLVAEANGVAQGLLLAHAFEHDFGPVWLAQERVWWIDPIHRGLRGAALMLDAYECWAKEEQGCAFAGMAGMGDDPDVAKLYLRRGYRVAETHFLKVL
jgi:hypothetical protein